MPSKAKNQQNALHLASSKKNISIVQILIENKCSARVKDKRGQLPLHRAAAVGSVPILKQLLKEGKSPVNATDIDGYTALHQAIAEGHGLAAILLLQSGADPLKRDRDRKLAIELVPDDKVCFFPRLCRPELTSFLLCLRLKISFSKRRNKKGLNFPSRLLACV